MKKLVSMVMGLAAAAAFAIPVPPVQVLSFSIQGTETYEGGAALADGECYALVWSADGQFGGLNADGTVKRAGDEVVYIGKIMKDRAVSFQIADGFKSTGYFDVWILDTRVFDNGAVKSVGKTADGAYSISRAAKAATAAVTLSGSQSAPGSVQGGTVVIDGRTINLADVPAPVIDDFKAEGDYVIIEMKGTIPGVNYAVLYSVDVTRANPVEVGLTTGTADGSVRIIAPKAGDSGTYWGVVK